MEKYFTNAQRQFDTQQEVLVELEEQEVAEQIIVLYNDDFNSFEFVIESLIEVCGHDVLQAEQCTYLVHYKGKCAVKTGTYEELEPICTSLLERNLTAQIE
jgi:ATP-dependent Clp protease adaptor protein ClpS